MPAFRQIGTGARRRGASVPRRTLVFLTKGKLLPIGLTKLKTFLSMLAFGGVYWAMYGWVFAVGLVVSIYIHEMGHVLELRKLGIPADAPMFIPGLGAFVRLRRLHITPVEDSRIGLAGPIYGLGAAAVALCVSYFRLAWGAITHLGAILNLFNLIPVWQLDGSRGFRSLTRKERGIILASNRGSLVRHIESNALAGRCGSGFPDVYERSFTGAGFSRANTIRLPSGWSRRSRGIR
jgi:Zn-dependent protease